MPFKGKFVSFKDEYSLACRKNEEDIMKRVEELRKQEIACFSGMGIDMDYILCIPSVHAAYQDEDIVVDFNGNIRQFSEGFPQDKKEMLIQWVKLHEKEILENHDRVNHIRGPLIMIESSD